MKKEKEIGLRERDVHGGAPREDFVLVASDLEAIAVFLEADYGYVGESLLTYRLHQ
jgi:hypothetical protein